MKIQVDALIELLDRGVLIHPFDKIAHIFLAAINDWPAEVKSIEEFIAILKNELREELNEVNLKTYLNELKISTNAWKVESISELLDLYLYFYKNESLNVILNRLQHAISDGSASLISSNNMPEC